MRLSHHRAVALRAAPGHGRTSLAPAGHWSSGSPTSFASAFSLVELLVVIAIIALLLGLLLPSLGGLRAAGRRTKCLTYIRSLEQAHNAYMVDNRGLFIDSSHNGVLQWLTTLQSYEGGNLIVHSPVDDSPNWPANDGGQGLNPVRQTSYGLNDFLTPSVAAAVAYVKEEDVAKPMSVVHFVMIARTGAAANADHVHAGNWWVAGFPQLVAAQASADMFINAHGGNATSPDALANYAFLDGHAATLKFSDVYVSNVHNHFDPAAAP